MTESRKERERQILSKKKDAGRVHSMLKGQGYTVKLSQVGLLPTKNLSDLHELRLMRIKLKKVDGTVRFVCYFLSYANI